jgi:hypothetical protein
MMSGVERRRQNAIGHLHQTIATLERVIRDNRALAATFPAHQASAEDRELEAEQEMAMAEDELARLEAVEDRTASRG